MGTGDRCFKSLTSMSQSSALTSTPQDYSSVVLNERQDYESATYCSIIAEGLFFVLSFFVLLILPFGLVRLRTFRLVRGLVRCTHWVQVFTRMWQSQMSQKKPDRKWRHAGSPEGFGIWKKTQLVEIYTPNGAV